MNEKLHLKRKRKTRKVSKFWLVYAISASVLLVGIAVGLGIFYDFIDAFEESMPQNPSEVALACGKELTEEELGSMVRESYLELFPDGEDGARLEEEYAAALRAGGFFCKRTVGEGTEEMPVYSLMSGTREICRISLAKTSTGRYGFKSWIITDRYVVLDMFHTYTVTAPEGAVVKVNGEALGEEDITERDIPYAYAPYEKGDGLPVAVCYTTEPMETAPEVEVGLGEYKLEVTGSGYGYTAKYPAEMLYTATVNVPAGAEVTVNGQKLSLHVTPEEEDVIGGMITEGITVPKYDVYKMTGLYAPLEEVQVTLDGTALQLSYVTDGRRQTVFEDTSANNVPQVSDFADNFVRTYFTYTAYGYSNIDAHLAAVLALVAPDTELYAKIRDSKIGYDYVTPVTSQVYNRLEVLRTIALEDGSYIVTMAFDVDHTIYSEARSYVGELHLHVSAGVDKVREMVIINE